MKRPTQTLIFITILLSTYSFLSCSKKNEIKSPETPVTGIGFQNTNLLSAFDPGFENSSTTASRPPQRNSNKRYFRVANRRGTRTANFEISNIAARSGQMSLRLLEAGEQTLIIPAQVRNNQNALQLVSGARYRVQAYIRLPRRTGNRQPQGTVEVAFKDNNTRSGTTDFNLSVSLPDSNNWHALSGEFEVPSLVNEGKLLFQFSGSRDLLIDDISLIRIR